jgi:5-methylcytosine-specific restriction endonuclease McrA
MVLVGRATLVESRNDANIRSATESFPVPSVISINRYVNKARISLRVTRKNLFWRDNYTCQYCRLRFSKSELTIDHVTPKSAGGPKTWENIVAACKKCNQKKGSKLPKEANMIPMRRPQSPSPAMFCDLADSVIDEAWKKYLEPYSY